MGLTNKKEDQLRKMPIVEARITKSKDNKYVIHKTIITDIKPLEYYKVVLESTGEESDAENTDDVSVQEVAA